MSASWLKAETGLRNVSYLDSLGLSGRHVVLAHCVHLDAAEFQTLANTALTLPTVPRQI